ncbi:MAG: hypothetical protein OQK32_08920, partial [Gammaproteobacteria bacterium]|nr:hypothetical protein [Gammaproteobacteria bacterium]
MSDLFMKIRSLIFSSILLCMYSFIEVQAGTLDDISFTDLKLELGTSLPDGSSITVTQVESSISGACAPDISLGELSSKIYNNHTTSFCSGISSHATSVATRFYGTVTSSSTAIGTIDLYEANNWVGNGFLNTLAAGLLTDTTGFSAARLVNHSWSGNSTTTTPNVNSDMLHRIDFSVEVDDYIHVVGVGTNTITSPIPSNSFNAIVSGVSYETGVTGTTTIDATYVSARAKPDVVVPETTGSASAARTSSAVVLLVDHAHKNPSLSNGSASNRNGDTIYNAERSETIKAILMAGADRNTLGNTNPVFDIPDDNPDQGIVPVDVTDYRSTGNQTSNGLDTRFGAGQINVYNSYYILDAGEQNSVEDGGSIFSKVGFDYDPSFGGLNSSNAAATYGFITSAAGGQKLKASLVWNLDVLTATTDNFYNLDLQLIDVTGGGAEVIVSNSSVDNTENLWLDLL